MNFKLASYKVDSQLLRVRQKKMRNHSSRTHFEQIATTDFTKDYKIALRAVNPENIIGLADHEPEFIVLDSRHVSYR